MSNTYIPAELRRLVLARAHFACEYCLIHEADTYFGCQADHIISEKHGGATEAGNLACASLFCNRYKGSDIGSIDWETGAFVRFFNPRIESWNEHFALRGAEIVPLTPMGRVTARILRLNHTDRQLERHELLRAGRYPPPGTEGTLTAE